jgi:hypothetical protein
MSIKMETYDGVDLQVSSPWPVKTFEDRAMPVELLRDHRGIYGIGVTDDHDLVALSWSCGAEADPRLDRTPRPLILRPDHLCGNLPGYSYGAALQKITGGFRHGIFCHSTEEHLRQFIHHEALRRAGLPWPPPDRAVGTYQSYWSDDKAQQARNRGIYHGLRQLSLCVINRLIGELHEAVNQPDAIRAARRFTLRCRERIYRAAAQSKHALQLADVFPVAALAIYADRWPALPYEASRDRHQRHQSLKAASLVERGARLRDVAAVLGFPMALRHVKPGAAHLVDGLFIRHPDLLQYIPATTPGARIWLQSVEFAARRGDLDYARWVARHVTEIPGRRLQQVGNTVSDLLDWKLANTGKKEGGQFVTRRFTSEMGLKAAVEASHEWHEAVASNMDSDGGSLPPPWYPAAKVGAFEIIPIETAAELVREGYALHHCVGTYADDVRAGACYVFSIRRDGEPVATLALVRDHDNNGKQSIGQVRGPCNAEPPKAVMTAVHRWFRDAARGTIKRGAP